MLAGCGGVPRSAGPGGGPTRPATGAPADGLPPGALTQGKSRWLPVDWSELPGFETDALHEAWNAWLRSCERPPAALAALCPDVRRLSIASADEQRRWIKQRLQPYRVEPLPGANESGLLTAYYEPVLDATRQPSTASAVPLYRPPADLATRRPWFTRQEIDTLPQARAALRGREIAYLADPLDALMLQIQGSGRLRITEPDGSVRVVRLAFAGSNEHPYRSVGGWLLQQGVRDASWPGIKAWAARNPQRVNEMLWTNPRTIFFREEPLADIDAAAGPRGAQGLPLTPGRSIAVDKDSIPYGAPVWLASSGLVDLQRLVLAQDTGSAITGAVRADYFVGWGPAAGEIAGRLKQPLRLWVLWPR
jgi:membrane-bound lytic murein transglycosylase A